MARSWRWPIGPGSSDRVCAPTRALDQQDGLIEEDIDGDGRILMMRVRDPNGAWKPYPGDPRLLIPRDPDDAPGSGEFYRLLTEGTIQNYDGVTIKTAPSLHGLDLNRNYPMEWVTESDQHGAGPYPTSEPEIRAMVQAVIDRPNITGYITYHTFSGVHLRPYSGHPDDDFPNADLRAYKYIGERATKITGYPAKSVFHDFKYEPKQVIRGGSDDWMYDHMGVYAWTTEFWSPQQQIGLKDYHLIEWMRDHPIEDDLKLLKWSDEVLQPQRLRRLVSVRASAVGTAWNWAAGTPCTAGPIRLPNFWRKRLRRIATLRSSIC